MNLIKALLLLLVLEVIGAAAFVYFGVFNAAADVPHWPVVYQLMEATRQRSIAMRAKDIQVPPLDDPTLIADGADHYREMCTGCHLAPGMIDSEIRPGLYPQPPNLSQPFDAKPAEMFWTIKHGIKMSAMPAWGGTHDDQAIWGMVAFLKKLPGMTPEQYQAMTKSSGEGEQGHHHHGESETGGASAAEHDHDEADQDHHHDNGDTRTGGHDHADQGEQQHHHHGDTGLAEPHKHDGEATAQTPEPPLSLEGLKTNAVPDAEQVAVAFHNALQKGNRDAVLALLSADVTVSEAGHTQSRDEYAKGHLGEDIAFLKKAQVRAISVASMPMGDAAMVGSESEIREVADQSKVSRSRELLTLKRENGTWKILAIRWESIPSDANDHAAHAHDRH